MSDKEFPKLIKGQQVVHKSYGKGIVRRDESCGVCLIEFTSRGGGKIVREFVMRLARDKIKLLE